MQAGLVMLISIFVPLLSAAPVPQSKEWTMGAGILFGAIAAGMFVKGDICCWYFLNIIFNLGTLSHIWIKLSSGAFIKTGDYAADLTLPKLTLGAVKTNT